MAIFYSILKKSVEHFYCSSSQFSCHMHVSVKVYAHYGGSCLFADLESCGSSEWGRAMEVILVHTLKILSSVAIGIQVDYAFLQVWHINEIRRRPILSEPNYVQCFF